MRNPLRRRYGAIAVALGALAVGCGDDETGGNAERFCGEIETHRAALVNPDLTFADDVQPLLDLYRNIGELAPLAIEAEWNQLILNYETASTVVPGDEASVQHAVATAYESEQAAAAVNGWLVANCALDLGPLSTIVAQDGP